MVNLGLTQFLNLGSTRLHVHVKRVWYYVVCFTALHLFGCWFDSRHAVLWNVYGECENYAVMQGHTGAILDIAYSADGGWGQPFYWHMQWYIVHIGFIYSNSSSMLYNDTTAFGWWDWVRMNTNGSATDGSSAVIPNCLFIADAGQYQHLIQHLIWRTKDIT